MDEHKLRILSPLSISPTRINIDFKLVPDVRDLKFDSEALTTSESRHDHGENSSNQCARFKRQVSQIPS
jgi:hypothetical protein